MRDYSYMPHVVERLADLNATDSELDTINEQVAELAANPDRGYLLPFDNPELLRRYDVGRFGLIYRFDDAHLDVVAVVG